ncbi:MAG: sugar ABC transporter substrate-binding protein [Planctomycetes bacterium]|nr:sugar ABC transporter substrate-binding protein [Planctomycetota bacterium]
MRKTLLAVFVLLLAVGVAWGGESIRVLVAQHSWSAAMQNLIPGFEKETGIRVQLEQYGEDQLSQKLAVEFTAGSVFDVYMTRPPQEARMMSRNGWWEDLTKYFKGDADYDFDDFTDGAVLGTRINGVQTSIPLVNEMEVLYYRKDLLDAKGIKVPTTFEELEDAARQLADRQNDVAGFIARGQRSPLVTQFSSYLYSFGGDFFDSTAMKSLIDTPEFLAAADFYGRMLREYGPPGVLNMHWPQAVAVFAQGKAAMYTDASSIYANLLDPDKSSVAATTEVAVFPKGPKAHKTYDVTAWGLAMSSKSANKDAAWKFIRYMTDKPRTMILQGEYANQCARKSTFTTSEGTKNFPSSWVKAVAESGPIGVGYDRPLITAVQEARDAIGEVITDSIAGRDFRATAKRADASFQELLDREKREAEAK